MRFLKRSIFGVFLLFATLSLLALAGNMIRGAVQDRMSQEQRDRPQRERVFAVNVITYEPTEVVPRMTVFGQVQSRRSLELRSAVGGTVVEVGAGVEDGGAVSEGDLLLRIDPVDAETALARVRADQLEAEADLRDAERTLVLSQDELESAEDQARLRENAFERQQDLQARGVGTATAVETAELAASSARQTVLARRSAIAQAETRIDQARTQLARVAISLTEATRDLENTAIQAEFDGILSGVSIVQGGRVGANEVLGRLIDPSELEAAFRISTEQYTRLLNDAGTLVSSPLQIVLNVGGIDLITSGRIDRESAEVGDGQTGRLLFATLSTTAGFRAGDFVSVLIDEPALQRVAQLPATALGADGTVLAVKDDERLEEIEVTLLRRQGDDVIVQGRGLRARMVVSERSPLLGAGIKVRALGAEDATIPDAPAMVELTSQRREKLIAFVEGNNRMPAEAKARVISQLEQDEVPAQMIERIESRMGS
ncbi:MAG: biotin/lipoyl-binding protein [Paracoccaceae bacterium]|nr:biotin/lipoyl-binding protein [Paracoccaceae bacterium]